MASGYGGPGKDHMARLWDVATLKEVKHFGNGTAHSLSYAPDGKTLATGNADGTVGLWDTATGREAHRIKGHQREVRSVAFSPDGKAVASCSFDGGLFLWDAGTGKLVRPFVREGDLRRGQVYLLAVAFAPNGKMLATAEGPPESGDRATVTLWEVATGKPRLWMTGHQGDVNAVAFTPDGRSLVTGSTDTTALVWDVMAPPASAGGLTAAWDDLLVEDAARGYRAICALAKSSDGAAFLAKRLPPATEPGGRVARLIQSLDSDVFDERNKASQELEKLGEVAEPALRNALNDKPSAEARKRLGRLVGKLGAEWLRTQRAVEALELAGTPASDKVLQSLAGGAPDARLTREAKAALGRLQRRK
jgi:dipeptidyl aminopeptidase/acylaminoacyl peptidase